MVGLKPRTTFAIVSESEITNPLNDRSIIQSSSRNVLGVVFCALMTGHWVFSEVKPVDSADPVLTFWIVELGIAPSASHVTRFNDLGQPIPEEITAATLDDINNVATSYSFKLITKGPQINSFQSIILSKDNKGVTVVLKEPDRKSLANLTGKSQGQYLCWFAAGTDHLFSRITAPVEDGVLEFSPAKSKASGDIAQSLRKRFRLGEIKK